MCKSWISHLWEIGGIVDANEREKQYLVTFFLLGNIMDDKQKYIEQIASLKKRIAQLEQVTNIEHIESPVYKFTESEENLLAWFAINEKHDVYVFSTAVNNDDNGYFLVLADISDEYGIDNILYKMRELDGTFDTSIEEVTDILISHVKTKKSIPNLAYKVKYNKDNSYEFIRQRILIDSDDGIIKCEDVE